MSKHLLELNELNFAREVLDATQPVLVEFWAGWSASCGEMAPMLESLAGDDSAALKVARVNIEHHEQLTERYGVRTVPTLLIFNQGGVQHQIVGRTTEQSVRKRLEELNLLSESQIQRNPQPFPVGATGAS